MFALFLPPVVGFVIGILGVGAGVAVHSVALSTAGALCLIVGGARWLRQRNKGGAAR